MRRWGQLAALCATVALLGVYACQVASRARLQAYAPTPILYDRHDAFLAQFGHVDGARTEYGYWTVGTPPDRIERATLALEDRRFAAHPGVDLRAILRAAWQHLQGGRSGASTIAMQVARMQHPERRTLWSKAVEAGTALALTARYGRQAVLAQYLRLAPYGNGSHGIAHAARWYFQEPAADLSWAQIALLSAVPQAPGAMNLLHPAGLERARQRGQRILTTLADDGVIPPDQLAAARAHLAVLTPVPPPTRPAIALHAILRLQRLLTGGALLAETRADRQVGPRLHASLDLGVQQRVADAARTGLDAWREAGAQQVAVMVVQRHTRQVLAALGSAGFDTAPGGRADFTAALRSPGSTLKPFLYAMALDRLALTPAQVMLDTPGIAGSIGNADGAFLGPMLPRQALANSRNVPAAALLRGIGLQRAFERLRDMGLHDLDGDAQRFGLSMAIGALPSSLDRLVTAYAMLAEDGRAASLAWLRDQPTEAGRQLIPLPVARAVTGFLSDPLARLPSFARNGPVEYPFAVALKTGTSQGYRDAWVVAWSQAYMVGVWVGRADAGPMTGLSGALSAAGLAQAILLDLHGATRGDFMAGDFAPPPDSAPVELCAATGLAAVPGCPSRLTEFLPASPTARPNEDQPVRLSIISPVTQTHVWRNPDSPPAMNRLVLRAQATPPVSQVVWQVDGRDIAVTDPAKPFAWPLVAGKHRFQLRLPLQPGRSPIVTVVVQ